MYTRPWSPFALAAALLSALSPFARAAGPGSADHERDDVQLVTAGGLLAVTRRGEVAIHDHSGRRLTTLPAGTRRKQLSDAGAGSPSTEAVIEDARERLWDRLGVPEELRDSDAAQDLVDDELLLGERRPSASPPAPTPERESPPARAAAAGQGLVVLAGGRLYRIAAGLAPELVGPAPTGTRDLAASDDGTIFVTTEDRALVSSDGGRAFKVLAREPSPRGLVADPAGHWVAFASAGRLLLLERSGRLTVHVVPALRSMEICAGRLALLDGEGLATTGPGLPLARGASSLPARRLACARDGRGPWLAVGPGLLASADLGRHFRPRRDAPASDVAAAAVAGDRLWLWIRALGGLTPLPLSEGLRLSPAPSADPLTATAGLTRRQGWMRLLPRVGLLASHAEQQGRTEHRALVFAELPLAATPSSLPVLPRGALLAQVAAEPAAAAPAAIDPGRAAWLAREAACLPEARSDATRVAGADPERAESFVRRAGRSAWLPELRLRVEQRLGRSESLDVKPTSATDALGLDTDNDVRYEVRATWDLPRLVFHPEEVAAAHQALRMADMRREIESQVNRLYFERRRLVALGGDAIDEVERAIRLEELGAELDALSQGGWTRCLRQGR
jgi:hypothetical protein